MTEENEFDYDTQVGGALKHNKKAQKMFKFSTFIRANIFIVYDFTVKPENTSKWLPFVMQEERDRDADLAPEQGTKYRNRPDENSAWTEYVVISAAAPRRSDTEKLRHRGWESPVYHAEFTLSRGTYFCSYEYKTTYDGTILTYCEWDTAGNHFDPFSQDLLDNCKHVIEAACAEKDLRNLYSRCVRSGESVLSAWRRIYYRGAV